MTVLWTLDIRLFFTPVSGRESFVAQDNPSVTAVMNQRLSIPSNYELVGRPAELGSTRKLIPLPQQFYNRGLPLAPGLPTEVFGFLCSRFWTSVGLHLETLVGLAVGDPRLEEQRFNDIQSRSTLPFFTGKFNFNIILPSAPTFPHSFLLLDFLIKILYAGLRWLLSVVTLFLAPSFRKNLVLSRAMFWGTSPSHWREIAIHHTLLLKGMCPEYKRHVEGFACEFCCE